MTAFSERSTDASAIATTTDLLLAPSLAAELSGGSSANARCARLVHGSCGELTSEMHALLHARLRLATTLMAAGLAIFLVRHLLGGPQFGLLLLVSHILVTAVLGAVSAILWFRCPVSLSWLRAAEVISFAVPTVFFALIERAMVLDHAARGYFMFNSGMWLILLFTYALFIPNTRRRAAVVIGVIAATPIVLMVEISLLNPEVARLITINDCINAALTMGVSAAAAFFGVDAIHSLRHEAFEARQLGQYHLRERIGAGGMGEVYLAEHELLKRPCVIKIIRPDRAGDERILARFQREVRATAKLTHWNTVEIFDYGRTQDGTFYYVMEYLPGMSLAALVERFGPLPPERVIYLLRQACDALREAHSAGLVHRDIKPANIFAAQLGGVFDVVKLLDFGMVTRPVDEQPVDLTGPGLITGSPLYMAPEQAVGDDVDARADIYSLGAVGYFLLTGQPPFTGDNPMKILMAHVHEPVVPPTQHRPEVPVDLEEVILRCLAKEPDRRYPSAEELARSLATCESADAWSRDEAARWWRERFEQRVTV